MQRTNRAQQLYFQILEFAFKLCCFYLLYSSLYVCVYNVLFLGEVVLYMLQQCFQSNPGMQKRNFSPPDNKRMIYLYLLKAVQGCILDTDLQ